MRYRLILPSAAALLLSLCNFSFAQCSQATVRGTWAHQSHATIMVTAPGNTSPVPVPFAGLGVMKIDYQGRYTDHATFSAGGQVQEGDFAGVIRVNPDCTGTDTYTFGGEQFTGRVVILDNGNEMRYMPTKFPGGPTAGMVYFRRLWPGGPTECTSDMVRGVYAGSREGIYMVPVPGGSQPAPTPFSAVHNATIQNGGGTGASTASLGGTIVEFGPWKFSVQVNPDCTAILSYTGGSKQFPGQTFTGAVKYIVLDHGNELLGLHTEDNAALPVVIENMKRISMMPVTPGQ